MSPPPLHVVVAFHPDDAAGRALAGHVRDVLDADPTLPGLYIPTSFLPEDGSGAPPWAHDVYGLGERVLVVALAGDAMADDDAVDPTRWPAWVATQVLRPAANGRTVPFQIEDGAWPLHADLRQRNFARAFAEPPEARAAWVADRVVIELLRFLASEPSDPVHAVAPAQLFLSHAKADLGDEGLPMRALIAHLNASHPVRSWVDSGQIPTGGDFGEAIHDAVRASTVVAVRTRSWAGRPWCREEVLAAKEHGRPLVVVEALTAHEYRAFPYLGNVPSVPWTGDAAAVVRLALVETLRSRHAALGLDRVKQPDDHLLTVAPEALTVAHLPAHTRVLYPDPALGDEERVRVERSGPVTVETPWLRLARRAPLSGLHVALSTSPPHDPQRWGTSPEHVQAAMTRIAHALILAGATLHYGGTLGPGSYTQAIVDFVRMHPVAGASAPERLVNHVGWPAPFAAPARRHLRDVVRWERHRRPAALDARLPQALKDLPDDAFQPVDSAWARYAWARGMTAMRRAQTAMVHARVVLGGPVGPVRKVARDGTIGQDWYKSRIPGVVEEVLCSIEATSPQPVFLLGGWGGAARLLVDERAGTDRPELSWAFQQGAPFAREMKDLYDEDGDWQDYDAVRAALRSPAARACVAQDATLASSADVDAVLEALIPALAAVPRRRT
ncbi:MAG: TIR domain-containing protein [Alphaproteobacteria bacterium]|nr:TIR domain-containing protein [Alphaproteobacteria bacterium]